ncbi:activating transcription factor 7-interacting protein 2 isoform X1 [Xiphophorus hellerii]|uniref:activating transcription factor 7-interacting protein 2 isoform X1 n=2 Tax=Xiphophorus hellerii TaxID=8084 RepID=UPI0013B43D36|nr:activating transcription factor 7-interacting protein 2 isoform X1 [Xiphophorus hellerii]XP_032443370.1 activating transcription factor 7-interacting protein 2 isoform X1 [Xiphophorus hellerii]
MSSTPNQSPAFTCSSEPAGLSAKRKRMKHFSKKQLNSLRRDCRINIGGAFQSWRDLKDSHGFRSDAEVALHLLNETETFPPVSGPAQAGDMRLKISQSEVQALIEQEVHKAVANKERQIESIIQHIQDTNDEASFVTSIQRLENRVDAITRRAEVALSHLASIQKQSSAASTGNTDILGKGPEYDPLEASSRIDSIRTNCEAKSGELLKMMDTTRNALKNIRADNEVLTTALADLEDPPPVLTPLCSPVSKERKVGQNNQWSSNEDLCERPPPPCLSPCDSPELKKIASIKTEATGSRNEDRDNENQDHFDEPMAKRLKKEASPPRHSRSPASNDLEGIESMNNAEDMLMCPPLPNIPFPAVLKKEAASYKMPPRVDVNLAFIRNPTRVSVLWNVEDKDPNLPPMESYTILLTMETSKGSGVFLKWDTYDKLQAKPLPMCALINKFKRGHKLCAVVVGKDIFGRYGPYSKVVTAILPD